MPIMILSRKLWKTVTTSLILTLAWFQIFLKSDIWELCEFVSLLVLRVIYFSKTVICVKKVVDKVKHSLQLIFSWHFRILLQKLCASCENVWSIVELCCWTLTCSFCWSGVMWSDVMQVVKFTKSTRKFVWYAWSL